MPTFVGWMSDPLKHWVQMIKICNLVIIFNRLSDSFASQIRNPGGYQVYIECSSGGDILYLGEVEAASLSLVTPTVKAL